MSLVQVLEHVTIALDQDLGVLLTMAQLLISVTLDSLQEVRHEVCLLFDELLLSSVILLFTFLHLSELFVLLELICKILEVGGTVVILRREVLLFHDSVLCELL